MDKEDTHTHTHTHTHTRPDKENTIVAIKETQMEMRIQLEDSTLTKELRVDFTEEVLVWLCLEKWM